MARAPQSLMSGMYICEAGTTYIIPCALYVPSLNQDSFITKHASKYSMLMLETCVYPSTMCLYISLLAKCGYGR